MKFFIKVFETWTPQKLMSNLKIQAFDFTYRSPECYLHFNHQMKNSNLYIILTMNIILVSQGAEAQQHKGALESTVDVVGEYVDSGDSKRDAAKHATVGVVSGIVYILLDDMARSFGENNVENAQRLQIAWGRALDSATKLEKVLADVQSSNDPVWKKFQKIKTVLDAEEITGLMSDKHYGSSNKTGRVLEARVYNYVHDLRRQVNSILNNEDVLPKQSHLDDVLAKFKSIPGLEGDAAKINSRLANVFQQDADLKTSKATVTKYRTAQKNLLKPVKLIGIFSLANLGLTGVDLVKIAVSKESSTSY